MERAGVSRRYRGAEASGESPEWAYIVGTVGSGKTHLACSFLRGYLDRNAVSYGGGILWTCPKAQFTTAAGYLKAVKAGFNGGDAAPAYLDAPYLVIDDLGQESPTTWAVAELFELLNHRYSEELPTIITSQFPIGSIARRLSQNGGIEQAQAIASRLAQLCTVYDLGDRDRRIA